MSVSDYILRGASPIKYRVDIVLKASAAHSLILKRK